jgi:hypothetical protein
MSTIVACPGCATELTLESELFGQLLACPHCSAQFRVAGNAAPAPAAVSPPGAAVTPAWRGQTGALPAGFKLNEPPPQQPQVVVPRFKPLEQAPATPTLTQGGTLPEFSLDDAKTPAQTAVPAEKPPQTLTLMVVLAASLTLSACLLLVDFSPTSAGANTRHEAQAAVASFYGRAEGNLQPYQLLLRDAQRAHSRGDHATERANYREVLRLLRAENRQTSVTETHQGDEELEKAIAVLLAGE